VITRRSVGPRPRRLGHEELWRVCETIVAEQPLEGEPLARLREVLSAALFGYDDVLGERVLERPVNQRRFELAAALLLRDLMAIFARVARPEER
jgi:hypothetical protein